jgi:demethylmenaquinone methyltransferase/2-methoxy-6-polyprenyl-1,4-benzoquinol methylase
LSNTAPNPVRGAAPVGAADERTASAAVRQMFTDIAPRYDLLNHLLSFNVDRLWWRRVARTFAHISRRPEARLLDLCCGTGDMARALDRLRPAGGAPVLGVDFSHAMLERASVKSQGKAMRWIESDALRLPFADASFQLVVSAFGFRNLANYDAGLREIYRVLAPGGEAGILDFGEPGGLVGKIYAVYFRRVLPAVGTLISGVKGPYAYLPDSVKHFPAPQQMLDRMRAAGFRDVSWTPYTFGIAGLYRGTR